MRRVSRRFGCVQGKGGRCCPSSPHVTHRVDNLPFPVPLCCVAIPPRPVNVLGHPHDVPHILP
eukprot:916167-Lingulodinium_polyedra.AAC.1